MKWIYKEQQIHKNAKGAVQKLTYSTLFTTYTNKLLTLQMQRLGKSLFHNMSFKRSLEMDQIRTSPILDINRQNM